MPKRNGCGKSYWQRLGVLRWGNWACVGHIDCVLCTEPKPNMRPLNDNERVLAGMSMHQRNTVIALAAIVASLPKDLINRQAVLKNIEASQLFEGVAGKQPEVAAQVRKIVDQILGPQ